MSDNIVKRSDIQRLERKLENIRKKLDLIMDHIGLDQESQNNDAMEFMQNIKTRMDDN